MFGRKKAKAISYDPGIEYPVIRASICTGEQVAGFKNRESGQFREEMLIRNESEKADFCSRCGISMADLKKEY